MLIGWWGVGHGDVGTRGWGDGEMGRWGDAGMRKHGDAETRGRGDGGTGNGFTIARNELVFDLC
ncbi:MAG: hypothetical protein F6K24_32820 [Okeania sp. SIO2D1]|nr:hypothetical protein [Okeania sp. SIO2D1]